jgi:NAD(P)-dependent dehydrogenase (short-subunit alcohol dehydrogenase family)
VSKRPRTTDTLRHAIESKELMAPSVANSTVLVTGANGGLGTQFVRQALELGARKVYATARRPRAWVDPRIVPLPLDVTDESSIADAVAVAADTTIVINNAGISPIPDRILTDDMREIRKTFETNFFGALAVARAFAPVVGANGGGAYLNVHSVLSWMVADPAGQAGGHGAYSAAKSAFWSATNSLRLALADQGTHVLGLHFGYTDTPMTAQIVDDDKEDAADIVRIAYAALLAGDYEVSADARAQFAKQALSGPLEGLYPQLAHAGAI